MTFLRVFACLYFQWFPFSTESFKNREMELTFYFPGRSTKSDLLRHLVFDGFGQPVWFGQGNFVHHRVDLEAEGLDLGVPRLQDLSRLEVHRRLNLVDMSSHSALADHFAGDPLGLFCWNLQQKPQPL